MDDGERSSESPRDGRSCGMMASGPLSWRIVLWSFVAFIAAAAGQMTLIVWLPRLMPVFDEVGYLLAAVVVTYWLA